MAECTKLFGDKVVARALRLKDKLENKLAYLGRKSALQVGFVQKLGESYELTGKGSLALQGYTVWAYRMMVDAVAAEYVEKYKQSLLHNAQLWVRTDRRPIQDTGMELYSALIKPVQRGDFAAAIVVAKNFLLASEDQEKISSALQDLETQMAEMYPIIDDRLSGEVDHLIELQDEISSLSPEDKEGTLVDNYAGSSMVVHNPEARDKFLLKIQAAEDSKMTMDELWETILMPMVDHYTSKAYGPSIGGFDLGSTDNEKQAMRDSFPYDPNITSETWYKELPVQSKDLGKDETGRWKGRQIIRRREVHSKEFNHEESADFTLNNVYSRVEDLKDWRKNMASAYMQMPGARTQYDKVGYRKIVDDHYELVARARYIRYCLENNEEPTDRGFKKLLNRCLFYYSW
jgi:hypothetical protein